MCTLLQFGQLCILYVTVADTDAPFCPWHQPPCGLYVTALQQHPPLCFIQSLDSIGGDVRSSASQFFRRERKQPAAFSALPYNFSSLLFYYLFTPNPSALHHFSPWGQFRCIFPPCSRRLLSNPIVCYLFHLAIIWDLFLGLHYS